MRIGNISIILTVTEVRIFDALVAAKGSYLSRVRLQDIISQNVEHNERLIDSHLKRLRNKLTENHIPRDIIATGYGFGYKIDFAKINDFVKSFTVEG